MNEHLINRTTAPASPGQTAPAIFLQRKCACGGSPGVRGAWEECQENRQQRKAATATSLGAVPLSVSAALRASGQSLDAHTREYMEGRFGHDFGHVRIHTDTGAVDSARAVDALAYTVGQDVVFASGQYAPNTPAGRRLLAHELTHVLQQSAGSASLQPRLEIGAANDQAENEADRVAAQGTSAEAGARQGGGTEGAAPLAPPPP